MFLDSQALTDSEPEVSPPKKAPKFMNGNFTRKQSFLETAKSILVKDLSDSDGDWEEPSPSDIQIVPKDPVTACKEPFLDNVPRDRAFMMAEIFSGSGILAEEMSALGFVTRSVDYMTGGADHDISVETKVAQKLLAYSSCLFLLIGSNGISYEKQANISESFHTCLSRSSPLERYRSDLIFLVSD